MKVLNLYVKDWRSWPAHAGDQSAPPLLRRRVTPWGQRALAAAWDLPGISDARLILSSRHGEFARTVSLLENIINGDDLSPADFTLSVHHALIGLLSIVQSNQKGHTAIAAGRESFCFGLIEAAACLQENPNENVVLVHFDDVLPAPFAEFNDTGDQPIALALSLAAEGSGQALQFYAESTAAHSPSCVSHAQDFLNFLNSNEVEGRSVGTDRIWRWARHAVG